MSASSNALLKAGFFEFSAKPLRISLIEICKITLIPPLRSRPLFSSFSLASLYVVNPYIGLFPIESRYELVF